MNAVFRSKLLLPAILLGALAACSDQPLTPEQVSAPAIAGMPNAAIYVKRMDTTSAVKSADIVVTPEGGWFVLGKHGVYFPPNTICDPAKSTYGVTEWDKWCTTITRPIAIHAEIDPAKSEWIVFSPDLRFKRSSDTNRWVYLFMFSEEAAGRYLSEAEVAEKYKIDWLPSAGLPPVDEAISDATLKTRAYGNSGYLYRRVKHFSGYLVSIGRTVRVETPLVEVGVELF